MHLLTFFMKTWHYLDEEALKLGGWCFSLV